MPPIDLTRSDKLKAAPLQFTALRYFHEVVQCGSIRQAADRLYVAPSAVSRQISKIEHEYGALLFERTTHGMHLTQAGQILWTHLSTTFKALQRARSEIDDLKGVQRGELTVHCIEGLIGELLPEVLASYHAKFPNITFNIVVSSSGRIFEALAAGEADIGITIFAAGKPDVMPLISHKEALVALMSPRHPLAGKRSLRLSDLAGHRVAMPDASYAIRRLLDHVTKIRDVSLNMLLTTNSLDLARSLARKGSAVTISPRISAVRDLATGELVAVRLADSEFGDVLTQVCASRTRSLTSAAREFINELQLAFDRLDSTGRDCAAV
ncbi:LysR family transcriptional regulator [Lacisediminimonas sp.]|uniref:LysR family transcriptional regulator n=1 Tax=Lacisediminimonas sp. TaxID=3060582 RepID=UPI00271661B9|nr:LysR family transcriptional regulator [Lacisediminimonas sp.]MDO8300042.1 LysR family transcriptional regulator [Lacisediminimonas sp.]